MSASLMLSDTFVPRRLWNRCNSAVVCTHCFWHAKTRIWSFTLRLKAIAINAHCLWWPNWYTTGSRLFAHYRGTNMCGNGRNRCKQQQTLLQLSNRGKPFVLILVPTVCRKDKCAKFINKNIQSCLPNTKKKPITVRIMDLWIIMAPLLLPSS